jgi:phosphopentomutase
MIFQRVMDKVLDEFIEKGFVVYLDDIINFAENIEEHDRFVEKVIKRLKENNLKVILTRFCLQKNKLNC